MALMRCLTILIVPLALHVSVNAATTTQPKISTECNFSGGLQFISENGDKKIVELNSTKEFRRSSTSKEFLQQYDYFFKRAKTINANEKENDQKNVRDIKRIKSKFTESSNHFHYFYETSIGVVMLSRWEFSKEVPASCVPWDTINMNINGNYGGLVLLSATDDKNQCEWQASIYTNKETVQYTLLVKTKCSNGKPEIDSSSVIQALKDAVF